MRSEGEFERERGGRENLIFLGFERETNFGEMTLVHLNRGVNFGEITLGSFQNHRLSLFYLKKKDFGEPTSVLCFEFLRRF